MKIYMILLFALATAVCAYVGGVDSMAFQMAVATSVFYLVKPFLPRVNREGLSCADGDQLEELTKSLKDTRAELTKQQSDLKDAHKQVMDHVEKGLKLAPDVQENIDKAISKANDTATELNDVAKKMDELKKSIDERPQGPQTVRDQINKQLSGELKDRHELLKSREANSLRIVLKEITSADIGTGVKREPYIDSLVSMERQPLRIRDLLTVIPVQSDSVKYGQQVLRTNNARIVAHGTKKPYSEYKWEDRTATIETIAHLAKIHLQALWDAPRLAAEIESEMRFGLAFAEEAEILNGDGSTGHLSGLIDNATAYDPPAGMDTAGVLTPVDRLRVAILQIHLAYAVPDGHVLNPINVAEIDLQRRDPDNGGGYLYSRPDGDSGVARLWRLPVVESPSMAVGRFLTGAFKYSAHLYDRMGVQVLISTENDTDFEDNKATMRTESRIGLGVRRPYGLVEGPLTGSGS